MLHLVCSCGSLVSAPPLPGPREAACRECGAALHFPPAAAVGLGEAPAAPPPPAPAGPAGPAAPAPAPGVPAFGADERLDLARLESEAHRAAVAGRALLAAGLLGAGFAAAWPGLAPPEAAALACGAAFLGVVGWILARSARAACLAAVALSQRQREILRGQQRS